MRSAATTYGRLAQAIHWISALLIIILWPMGFLMARMADSATKTRLYQAHVAIGLLVLLLTLIRVVWHFVDTRPEPPDGLTTSGARTLSWTHNLLFLTLLVMVLSGVSILRLSGIGLMPASVTPEAIADVPPRTAHRITSIIFLLLFLTHVGSVIGYQRANGDIMARIGATRPGQKFWTQYHTSAVVTTSF